MYPTTGGRSGNLSSHLTTDSREKAEILQSQYVKVFSDPLEVDPEKAVEFIKESEVEISDISFTKADIEEALKELKVRGARKRKLE